MSKTITKSVEIMAPYVVIGAIAYIFLTSMVDKSKQELCDKLGICDKEYEGGKGDEVDRDKIIDDIKDKELKDCQLSRRKYDSNLPIPGLLSGIGQKCNSVSDCSESGLIGDKNRANDGSLVCCDKNKCAYKRKDWAGNYYPPSICIGRCEVEAGEAYANSYNNKYINAYVTCEKK